MAKDLSCVSIPLTTYLFIASICLCSYQDIRSSFKLYTEDLLLSFSNQLQKYTILLMSDLQLSELYSLPILASKHSQETGKQLQYCRPRWLSWMRRPTGDQEVAGSTPAEVGNILSWRLIMKYFIRSFSPFR